MGQPGSVNVHHITFRSGDSGLLQLGFPTGLPASIHLRLRPPSSRLFSWVPRRNWRPHGGSGLQFPSLHLGPGPILRAETDAVPQIQKHQGCLRRPFRVKSGEAEWNQGSEGMILDEETLQQKLEMAVKEENYALAAKLRDNLQLIHEDNKAAVLAANSRFYNAFRNGNLVAMRSIWAKGENICCVHPGAGAISGYDLVMDSWEVVCGADHEFPIKIELKDVEVYIKGDVGYVTCLEVIKTKGSSWGKQVATNVFERVDGQWYICIHHASHVDL
ncbi:hypothetical protein Taro_049173 [Colocasia esculenta]|uniref:SnoaL-like domain-containing protein n=1 Tax=Colocasia esculenta TaxID=4460 RepID=A0A843XA98_COLES|nr:hypothetical protein [Colocasia esculenta]